MKNEITTELSSEKKTLRFYLIRYVGLLLIGVGCFIVFSSTLKSDFIYSWDDNINVTTNPYIRDLSWNGIETLFNPQSPIDEPRLTLFTYALEYRFYSLNPAPYHLHNLLLHLLNILLLFFLVRNFLKKDIFALLLAFIFAIHPLHVEPVAWITGRKDLLFTFFYLCSLLAYIRFIGKSSNKVWLVIAAVFGLLSLLSKIQALTLPLVWIAIDVYYKKPITAIRVFEKVAFIILLLYNYFSLPQIVFPFGLYLVIIYYADIIQWKYFQSLGRWLQKRFRRFGFLGWMLIKATLLIILFRKINMWDVQVANVQTWLLTIIEMIFIIIIYCKELVQKGKLIIPLSIPRKYIKYLLVACFISLAGLASYTLLPYMNLWTDDFRLAFSPFDRILMASYSILYYAINTMIPYGGSPIRPYPSDVGAFPLVYYLAFAFVILIGCIGVWLLWKLRKNPNRAAMFGLTFFVINVSMVLHFISIEGRVIVADRYAYLALAGLLLMLISPIERLYLAKGKQFKQYAMIGGGLIILVFSYLSNSRTAVWKNGFALFAEVIKNNPNYELAYINRGTFYLNSQQNQKAVQDFDKAISLNASLEFAFYNRALAWYNLGDMNKAYQDCSHTIQVDPEFFDAWYLRAYIKNQWKNFSGAIADYNATIKLQPKHKLAWYNRGNTKKNLYDYKGALSDYQHCIDLDTNFHMAYNAKGVALFFLGDYQESIKSFDIAIRKNPGEGNYFFNRGLSKLRLNETDEACRDLETSWGLGYSDAKNTLEAYCK